MTNIQDSYFVQRLLQGRLVLLKSDRRALHLRFLSLEIGHLSRQFLDSLVQQLFLWADLLNVLVKVLLSLLSLHQHLKEQTQIFWYLTVLALHALHYICDDKVYWLCGIDGADPPIQRDGRRYRQPHSEVPGHAPINHDSVS